MKMRYRYGFIRWYPSIIDDEDFIECVKYTSRHVDKAGIFDFAGRCMLALRYYKAGLYLAVVMVGRYPKMLTVMASPSEGLIFIRPGRPPADIVKAYREAVILDGRMEE
jgi:hypothetical protein